MGCGGLLVVGTKAATPAAPGSSVGMRRIKPALLLAVVVGFVIAGATSGRAAIGVPCCPLTVATTPCTQIIHSTSEATPSADLRALLAPLGRAQTPADLPSRSFSEGSGISLGEELAVGEGVYSKFIRRAAVINGESLYLVPVERACDHGTVVREAVFLIGVRPQGSSTDGPATAESIEREGLKGDWGWETHGNKTVEVVPGVAPKGVAKVTLLYPRHSGLPASVTVAVVNNVFVAFVPSSVTQSSSEPLASYVPASPRKIVWRSRKGKVLKTLRF
jgi:hypothetical protein